MIRPILLADEPILRQKAKRVRRFEGAIQALVDDMVETMHQAKGVGLAAPQIGVPLRLIVVELPEDHEDNSSGKLFVLFNPEIVKSSEEDEEEEEGCLCLPGYVGTVRRANSVTVKGQDRQGRERRIKAEGFLARVFQHEIDHLNGILYLDHLESPDALRRLPTEEGGPSDRETAPLS